MEFLYLLQRELGIKTSPDHSSIYEAGSPESQRATRDLSRRHMPTAWIDTYYSLLNTPVKANLSEFPADKPNDIFSPDFTYEKEDEELDYEAINEAARMEAEAYNSYFQSGEAEDAS